MAAIMMIFGGVWTSFSSRVAYLSEMRSSVVLYKLAAFVCVACL